MLPPVSKGLANPSGSGGRGLPEDDVAVLFNDNERDDALDRDDSESDLVDVALCAKT